MKNVTLVTFAAIGSLLSLIVGCAAQTEPNPDANGKGTQSVQANPGDAPTQPQRGVCVSLPESGGSANPAAVYCAALGYAAHDERCTFKDGTSCEQWAFYRGECGNAHSFCNLHGGTRSVENRDIGGFTAATAMCTLSSGAKCTDESFAHSCSCDSEPAPVPPAPAPPTPPSPSCQALPAPNGSVNPASVYCAALGYDASGESCTFKDGTSCEQWAFYRGECGHAHSFCNLHGGTVSNKTEDQGGFTTSKAVCALDAKTCDEQSFATSCTCQ